MSESPKQSNRSQSAPPPLPNRVQTKNASKSNARMAVTVGKSAPASKSLWLWVGVPSILAVVVWALVIWNFVSSGAGVDLTDQKNRDHDAVVAATRDQSNSQLTIPKPSLIADVAPKEPNAEAMSPPQSENEPAETLVTTTDSPVETSEDEPLPVTEKMESEEPLAVNDPPLKDNGSPPAPDDGKPGAAGQPSCDELIQRSASLLRAVVNQANEGRSSREAIRDSFKEAMQPLIRASNQYRNEIRPDFYLGLIYSGVGVNDPKEARDHFHKVLTRSPQNLAAKNNLALTEIKLRKFESAHRYLKEIADKNQPHANELIQNLGRLDRLSAEMGLKGKLLKQIQNLNSNNEQFRPKTGWMYMSLGSDAPSDGEFKSFCKNGNLEDRSCPHCNGWRGFLCPTCNSKGTVFTAATFVENRAAVSGTVTFSTPTTTVSRCPTCSGLGFLDCKRCLDGTDLSLK